MKTNSLFEMINLKCAYGDGQVVLDIPYLDIDSKKITAIIGNSGIGKSTLLESMSLMNNTIKSGIINYRLPGQENEPVNIASFWDAKQKPKSELIEFREKQFSFIFQTPFLLKDYQVKENLLIPKYLQSKEYDSAWDNDIAEFIEKLKIDIQDIDYPNKISIGQQQRIAFAYALLSEFNVLFCDEPTGSLDKTNAENLLNILRQTVKNHEKSAVIVSHEISLMQQFADTVILLKKDNKNGFAVVDNITHFTH